MVSFHAFGQTAFLDEVTALHWKRTENSFFVRQDSRISTTGYPSFLMYMYNIIWIISLSLCWKIQLYASFWNKTMNPLTKLIFKLGSTNSGPNNVRLKPFSATIFKFFIWIIATITKIYTKNYFNLNHSKLFS